MENFNLERQETCPDPRVYEARRQDILAKLSQWSEGEDETIAVRPSEEARQLQEGESGRSSPAYARVGSASSPAPSLREGSTEATDESAEATDESADSTDESTGNEPVWDWFVTPSPSSTDLQKAMVRAKRAFTSMGQHGASNLEFKGRTELLDLPGASDRTSRDALQALCAAADWIEDDRKRDLMTVELLKRFYNREIAEDQESYMYKQLYQNRVAAARIEKMLPTFMRETEENVELLVDGDVPARKGRRFVKALQVRMGERLEELWQLHLLAAWVNVQSERDCLFRSPWLDPPDSA